MDKATITVEVLERNEKMLRVRFINGFGDPVIIVHQDCIKIEKGAA